MNQFGGKWTSDKIQIVEDYAKAYLQVMKDRPYFKLLYFDGFAGSGSISIGDGLDADALEGAARRVLSIESPRLFDMYYFVELDKAKAQSLKEGLKKVKEGGVYVVSENCNKKLIDLAEFLKSKENKNFKVLAFLDPFGMALDWESIQSLKGLPIDLWILIPTGLGANRMLKRDVDAIPNSWFEKLENFFGIPRELIKETFYETITTRDLFGEETYTTKISGAIEKIEKLYIDQLKKVFNYVSNPYILANSTNSVMFHFVLASNNETAVRIANDIIHKKTRKK